MKANQYKPSADKSKAGSLRGLLSKTQKNTIRARVWARRGLTHLHQVVASYRPADANNAGAVRGILMLD